MIDSVSRQWLERARKAGQAVSKNAAPGTFASGVQKITDVLSVLMTDLIRSAPDNQKEKISKLLDIWERGQTFPHDMLAGFKQQLSSPPTSKDILPARTERLSINSHLTLGLQVLLPRLVMRMSDLMLYLLSVVQLTPKP